jgi:hypothetical protein
VTGIQGVLFFPLSRACCDLPSTLTSVGANAKIVPFDVVSCVRYSSSMFHGKFGYRYLAVQSSAKKFNSLVVRRALETQIATH